MRFAYADPPYPGMAARYRKVDNPDATEVDHAALVAQLAGYDGWALSTSSTALRDVLPLCPPDVRVMAWVKPFAFFKPGVKPAYAWEPVLVRQGRKPPKDAWTHMDWVSCVCRQDGFFGAKPDKFCLWLFSVLGMEAGDDFADLFPGSGAVTRAWEMWRRQGVLPLEAA